MLCSLSRCCSFSPFCECLKSRKLCQGRSERQGTRTGPPSLGLLRPGDKREGAAESLHLQPAAAQRELPEAVAAAAALEPGQKQEPIVEALVARPPLPTSCCWVPGERQMSLMLYV